MQPAVDTPATPADLDAYLDRLGHDLRNPLNALSAALAVLEVYPPGTAQAEEARQVIARQADRLRRLIDERLVHRGT